jgi:hypothetical protein
MRKDFHGSRTYESDDVAIGPTRLALAWIMAGAASRLRKLWRWAARPTVSEVLLRDGERHFSELGAQAAAKPAPQANNNWRVLP